MRKGPPYKVEFGKEGQVSPPYVKSIQLDRVVLRGCSKKRTELGLGDEVPLKGNSEANELTEIMIKLHSLGFAFSYDYKVDLSPSSYMMGLQDSGDFLDSFKEISWRNPQEWVLTTYEVVQNT